MVPHGTRSLVMRWNGQWIGGDRFARDYAAGIASFSSEVVQAVSRFHPAERASVPRELEAYAAVWAAVLVGFEAANFRDQDRETLVNGLIAELQTHWGQSDAFHPTFEETLMARSLAYFELRDREGPFNTAARFVDTYLRGIGLREVSGASALARHLRANFRYRILRDIYRLSAASRLRFATVSLLERHKPR
jgi:hypothetical protein